MDRRSFIVRKHFLAIIDQQTTINEQSGKGLGLEY